MWQLPQVNMLLWQGLQQKIALSQHGALTESNPIIWRMTQHCVNIMAEKLGQNEKNWQYYLKGI